MKKLFTLLVLYGLITSTHAQSEEVKFSVITHIPIALNIPSPNGKYLAGAENGRNYILNTETDELAAFYRPRMTDDIILSISNNGIAVGRMDSIGYSRPAYYKDGEWRPLPGNDVRKGETAFSISGDGSVISGYQFANADELDNFRPCIWTLNAEGEYEIQALPIPETDFFGRTPQGATAIQVSEDGNTILGKYTAWAGGTEVYPIIWKKTSEGYEYTEVGKDLVYVNGAVNEAEFITGHNLSMSGNGRYIILAKMYVDMISYRIYQHALLIDTEDPTNPFYTYADPLNGEFDVMAGKGDPVWGISVLNNGVAFASTPYQLQHSFSKGLVYLPNTNDAIKYEDWIKNEYGVDIFTGEGEVLTTSGCPFATPDGNLVGGGYMSEVDGKVYTYYVKKTSDTGSGIEKTAKNVTLDAYIQNDMLMVTGEVSKLAIYNLQGKLISEYQDNNSINVSNLIKGIYIVKLISVDGYNKTVKVIK